MNEEKTISFDDKFADGFCSTSGETGSQVIIEISGVKDKSGGYDRPYVNTLDGKTVVIYPGDKIVVKGKKVVRVINTKENG